MPACRRSLRSTLERNWWPSAARRPLVSVTALSMISACSIASGTALCRTPSTIVAHPFVQAQVARAEDQAGRVELFQRDPPAAGHSLGREDLDLAGGDLESLGTLGQDRRDHELVHGHLTRLKLSPRRRNRPRARAIPCGRADPRPRLSVRLAA